MSPEDADLLSEARVYVHAAPIFLPLLAKERQAAFDTLLGSFRKGKTDLLSEVANLNALVALEQTIIGTQQIYEKRLSKIGGNDE